VNLEVDLVNETVLLVDEGLAVRDAFLARGVTRHVCDGAVRFYTYRSLLTLPGFCVVCGRPVEEIGEPCSSSGGFHAFAGLSRGDVPDGHLAEDRALEISAIRYDELAFFVERDNLFPITEIAGALRV